MPKLIKKYQYGNQISWNPTYPTLQDPTQMIINYFDKGLKNTLKLPTGNFKGDPMVLGKMISLESNPVPQKSSGFLASLSKSPGTVNAMSTVGNIASSISNLFPSRNESPLTSGINVGYNAIADTVSSLGPQGAMIGTAMKLTSALGKGLDALTGGATTTSGKTTQDAILSSDFFKLTGLGLVNSIFGKSSKEYNKDLMKDVNVGYTADTGVDKAKYGLFSGGARRDATRLNERTDIANLNKYSAIYKGTQDNIASANTWGDLSAKNQQLLFGGLNTQLLSAKNGAKLEISLLVKKAHENVESFKKGGQLNVIPDGALHAHKHNLPDEISDQVTDKGIPVVSFDEGGEITQHAEIERNEIIFTKDVTDKLESLFKDYNSENADKDAIAIEAGKLLTSEILENTDDRTGLLNTIE